MNSRKLILSFTSLLIACVAFSQEVEVLRSDSIAKIDGEVYSIHVVQPKQTLFSIAKTYEVKLSRIAFDNPGVLEGLKLGQPLKILQRAQGETQPDESEIQPLELDGEYVLYTVPKQQTLYAISKDYDTTIEAILDVNPELSEGLKVGMTIRVPVPKMLGENMGEKVEMVGLPNIMVDRIQSQLRQDSLALGGKIALMLPLYFDLNDTVMARKLEGEPESIYERSEIGLAFYEGFLLALDSLNKAGHRFEVFVIDTENRPWKVKQLVKEGKLNDFDLIVGPLYGKVFAEVAEFAYQNCIPIVSPTLKGNSILETNDYVLKLIPSEKEMVTALGQYLALSDSTENIILHYGSKTELELVAAFRNGIESTGMLAAPFREMNIYKVDSDSLRNALSPLDRNNLIFLSTNEVRLASLLRNMSDWLEDAYIVGFAPDSWDKFSNIEMDFFDKFRIHLPTAFHIDYEGVDVQHFVQDFRERYSSEPSTFAFRGYDVAMHLGKNLVGIKEYGPLYLQSVQETGLQSDFRWKRVPNGGLENVGSKIIDYTNYERKIATD